MNSTKHAFPLNHGSRARVHLFEHLCGPTLSDYQTRPSNMKCLHVSDERKLDGVSVPYVPPDVNRSLNVLSDSRSPNLSISETRKTNSKLKVWGFLQWPKVHNRLYKDNLLDKRMMDSHPYNRADVGDMFDR